MTTKEKIQNFFENYIFLIPIIFALAVIPLIVRITYYDPGMSQYAWFADTTEVFDMFMYHKNQAMMQLDAILVVAYLYLWIRKKLPMDLRFMPLLVYVILVALSTIFSIAPVQTWNGFYGMLESAYALFGYCMICYYAFAVVRSEYQLKIVFGGFAIGFCVLMAIGISQFLGCDFYTTALGQKLIIPSEYKEMVGTLHLSFGEGRVYGSLFNPNYVGVYCCMLCPLLLVLAFSAKKNWHMAVYLFLLALVQVCFVGAGSKTTLLLMVPFLIFLGILYGKKHMKRMVIVFLFCIGMFGIINYQGEPGTSLVDQTISSTTADVPTTKSYALSDITLQDDAYYVTYNDRVLAITYGITEDEQLHLNVCDLEGNEIPLIFEKGEKENTYRLEGEAYEGLFFVPGANEHGNPGYSVVKGSARFFIYYSQKYQTYLYTNQWGRPTKLYASETFDSPFFHILGGFSGRAYIWSKSVPLLKETLLIGSGPDTFAFMFPQYDYVSLIQQGYTSQLLTKPHSMYLQMGVQTGVLSVIAFLAFNICYLVQSFKLYRGRKLECFVERCGAAIFVAVLGYLCAGLLHDSTVGTSIVYWALLGIGLACNHMIVYPKEVCAIQEIENSQEEE